MEIEAAPEAVLPYLLDPRHLPSWAPDFADTVVPDGQTNWIVSKNGAQFSLRVAVGVDSGTVDYLREVAPGRDGGAYLRVISRMGGGSVVVMTLPVPPSANQANVAATLKRELEALKDLIVMQAL